MSNIIPGQFVSSSRINPIPIEKIGETIGWREWALSITTYIQNQIAGDGSGNLVNIPQYTTALAPAYQKGAIYFDTTLNKLRVGGATAWETITSV